MSSKCVNHYGFIDQAHSENLTWLFHGSNNKTLHSLQKPALKHSILGDSPPRKFIVWLVDENQQIP